MIAGVNIDAGREARQGFPEVVFGHGKTLDQTCAAFGALAQANGHALATGLSEVTALALLKKHQGAIWNSTGQTVSVGSLANSSRSVAVVGAGTSDMRVAEECAHTCEFLGHCVLRVSDVGVAGLHRLLERLPEIEKADVVIAVAGMEGALPSVLGGLVRQPVIAIPTSVGYGTGLGGTAALMAMLNSCAAGVAVMNIDNGFGAAVAAHRILRLLSVNHEPCQN
jgi:pyridinium-3,5-biscarboxylic acid mononucleotide synthase